MGRREESNIPMVIRMKTTHKHTGKNLLEQEETICIGGWGGGLMKLVAPTWPQLLHH